MSEGLFPSGAHEKIVGGEGTVKMVAVGLAYSPPVASGITAKGNVGDLRRPPVEPAGSKAAYARTEISSGNTPEQNGVKQSENAFDEFRPYSRSSTQNIQNIQNIPESDTTNKTQGGTSSTGSILGKQDLQVQAEVARLKSIEEKVKAHEAAHKSAGGTMTGPVSYSYTRGPDNRNYITGGEVPISVSPGKTPQETVSRMQQVIRAALAPADPSPQDRAVAAQAAAQQQEASQKLAAAPAPPPAETPPLSLEPLNQTDSAVIRDSIRAYGNPAVIGSPPEIPVAADSFKNEPPIAASPASDSSRSSLAPAISPASIGDDAAFQPVSYYA